MPKFDKSLDAFQLVWTLSWYPSRKCYVVVMCVVCGVRCHTCVQLFNFHIIFNTCLAIESVVRGKCALEVRYTHIWPKLSAIKHVNHNIYAQIFRVLHMIKNLCGCRFIKSNIFLQTFKISWFASQVPVGWLYFIKRDRLKLCVWVKKKMETMEETPGELSPMLQPSAEDLEQLQSKALQQLLGGMGRWQSLWCPVLSFLQAICTFHIFVYVFQVSDRVGRPYTAHITYQPMLQLIHRRAWTTMSVS